MQPPAPPDAGDEVLLAAVETQLIAAAVQGLRGGMPCAPIAVGLMPGGLALFPVLDLQQRMKVLSAGISESRLRGFVFGYDGFIEGTDGRHEALLFITAAPTVRRARAVPYRRTVEGIQVLNPVEAPDDIAHPYQQLFAPRMPPLPAAF